MNFDLPWLHQARLVGNAEAWSPGFDPQAWEENDLARGAHVWLHGVNAVAGRIAVKMDGTQLERLVEPAPE